MSYIDPCEVSPDHYKILFTNEHLRVVEMVEETMAEVG